jgi:hypothetical protein
MDPTVFAYPGSCHYCYRLLLLLLLLLAATAVCNPRAAPPHSKFCRGPLFPPSPDEIGRSFLLSISAVTSEIVAASIHAL